MTMFNVRTSRRLYGRDHWAVTSSIGSRGPWLIQRAHSTEHGYRLDPPLPGHYGFRTKREAEAAKRELREKEAAGIGTYKLWDIWVEGYAATGEHGHATLLGQAYGETFREAVAALMARDSDLARYYNPEGLSYWGCRLFDNEADARKSFG